MNEEFLERIKSYIPDEFDVFLASLDKPLYRGLRVNTKKIDTDILKEYMPVLGRPSIFSKDSFYVDQPLGNHPFHLSGAFYLQEPSASAPVEIMNVQPDDIVLDLCAAPGSKSTQIAQALGDNGFLLSNEIDSKRVKILLSNMERMGIVNMAVTNTTPEIICSKLQGCFDKVLVDAPCSGEGMMKKHEIAKDNWSLDNVLFCAKRQKDILSHAYKALKKDGILVYSTCTYAKEENEDVIEWFLNEYKDMELIHIDSSFGREGFIPGVRRIFPMDQGEGHFMAKLQKKSGVDKNLSCLRSASLDALVTSFIKDQIGKDKYYFYTNHDKVYLMKRPFIDLKNIKVLRQGLYVGDIIKKRFEPAHAFYMANCLNYLMTVDVSIETMDQFMHGLEIEQETRKGYVALCYKGINFGFGKSDGKRIKNKIPKGLRLMEGSHVLKED